MHGLSVCLVFGIYGCVELMIATVFFFHVRSLFGGRWVSPSHRLYVVLINELKLLMSRYSLIRIDEE